MSTMSFFSSMEYCESLLVQAIVHMIKAQNHLEIDFHYLDENGTLVNGSEVEQADWFEKTTATKALKKLLISLLTQRAVIVAKKKEQPDTNEEEILTRLTLALELSWKQKGKKDTLTFINGMNFSPNQVYNLRKHKKCMVREDVKNLQNPVLDIISSIPYLFHFPLPFIYAIFLIRSKANIEDILRITLAYGLVNMIGVIIQYMVPTPPPWMVLMENKIPEANFYRVDNFLGIKIFKTIYSFSKLVCGAFPSLHTAWPSIILFGKNFWIGRRFCVLHVCLIAFSAVYSMHHYIIDVLSGIFLSFILSKFTNYFYFEKIENQITVTLNSQDARYYWA
ncbi:Inositol phosphorylceramide synthase catalytic subunit AUR1 [Brachionus plicatilis]|uniref:Inositol phosphorylceramide synthase catalytic subunit AUR1 n=1 Tax=Brachionus plicatilis TaxID=10195 RepID=A0A3M7QMI3_BRAPC|nr:Inositol phosphorylceramide synthase catalytic subunit AUR1 [Brachionus plicatilis]